MNDLLDPVTRSQHRADVIRESVKLHALKAPAQSSNALTVSGGMAGAIEQSTQRRDNAAEQLNHFTGWVFASIRPIAQRIAGQPIKLAHVKKRAKRGAKSYVAAALKGNRTELDPLDSHPLLDLLADPNEYMVAWSLMYSTIAALELTGKAYWWFPDSPDRPQVWPLPPSWVERQRDGWKVTVPGKTSPDHVDGEQIVFFSYPSPADPMGATSPLQAAARAVMADEALQTSQVSAFKHGIQAGLALVIGDVGDTKNGDARPMLEKHQQTQIINAVRERYAGVHNAHEPLILDALIRDVKQITTAPAEMDFLDSGKQTKERISQAFGVNPIVLGQVEGANRASSSVAEEHLCHNTVNPKIELLSQCMTAWLSPRFARDGEQLVCWIEPCRPSDPEQTRADYVAAMQHGCATRNEYRAAVLGLEPIDGGDVLLEPAGMLPRLPDEPQDDETRTP